MKKQTKSSVCTVGTLELAARWNSVRRFGWENAMASNRLSTHWAQRSLVGGARIKFYTRVQLRTPLQVAVLCGLTEGKLRPTELLSALWSTTTFSHTNLLNFLFPAAGLSLNSLYVPDEARCYVPYACAVCQQQNVHRVVALEVISFSAQHSDSTGRQPAKEVPRVLTPFL